MDNVNSDSNWEAEGSAFDCAGLCNGQAFNLIGMLIVTLMAWLTIRMK